MKFKLSLILGCILLSACSKSKKNEPEIKPDASLLIAPIRNSACTEAAVISQTISSVEFKWKEVQHADTYTLTITDLSDNSEITHNTAKISLTIPLKRNTAYSWFITAKSNAKASESEIWKFYNPGPGSTSHAPFPAEIILPTKGQTIYTSTGKITLRWQGSDSDNDILNYDVYLGTTTSPALINSAVMDTSLEDVSVNPKTSYFWKVITRDKNNNTSESDMYYFSTW